MDSALSTLDAVTLAIALWGALFSTYLGVAKRRRRLRVSAGWDTARLGDIRNHSFFVVRVVNLGQRAVTVREIEWEYGPDLTVVMHVFRTSKGNDLPEKVEPDEEFRVLFDPDHAAHAISPSARGAAAINVRASGIKRKWRITVTDTMREEASEQLERLRANDEDAE